MSTGTVYFLGFVLYGIVTALLWRNVSFPQPWKAILCLALVPIFCAGMYVNIALVDAFASFLFVEADRPGRGAGLVGFIIAIPLALVASVAWFWFVATLCNRANPDAERDPATRLRDVYADLRALLSN